MNKFHSWSFFFFSSTPYYFDIIFTTESYKQNIVGTEINCRFKVKYRAKERKNKIKSGTK